MANVAKLLTIQGGKCFYCGNKLALEDATIDHVVARTLGGDRSEANTVACCHSINQAFGNATAKEKLTAIINAGGRIDCPPKAKRMSPPPLIEPAQGDAVQAIPAPSPQPQSQSTPQAIKKTAKQLPAQKQITQKPAPEKKPSELRKPLQEAFHIAAADNGGARALLTTVSLELRKKVDGFAVKPYGEKTFARLVTVLGYRVDKNWCLPAK